MGTSQVAKRESSLLSSCEGELAIALELLKGNWSSSWVEEGYCGFSGVGAGSLGFLLSCNGDLGERLKLQKGVRPPFELQGGELGVSLQSLWCNGASSCIEEGSCGFS